MSEPLAPPQVFLADNYPHPAHNQNHQKAMPLPILDNRPADPLTAENRIFSSPPLPQHTHKP
jgi:hypothetical protein